MMVSKKTIFALLAVMVMGAISLAGCGNSSPTSTGGGGGATTPSYYVNAATGLDTNAGTQAAPFKSITKALAVASAATVATNIYVAPGTYSASGSAVGNAVEIFPLTLSNNVSLIGDVVNKGVGAASTTISGDGSKGNYTLAPGGINSGWPTAGVVAVVPAGVTNVAIRGFNIGGGWDYDILVDKATSVLIDSNTVEAFPAGGGNDLGVFNTSLVAITNNVFRDDNWYAHVEILDNAAVMLRNNTFPATTVDSVLIVGQNTTATSPAVDMGTAASPGGNTILGGANVVGLYVLDVASTSTIQASGNTWQPNIQGANAAGHYAAGLLITASTAYAAGNNYAVEATTPASGTPGIQFYGTGAATHPKKK